MKKYKEGDRERCDCMPLDTKSIRMVSGGRSMRTEMARSIFADSGA